MSSLIKKFPGGVTGDFAGNLMAQNMTGKNKTLRNVFLTSAGAFVLIICGWLAIPTVSISPANAQTGILLGQPVSISSSPLATISKIEIYADDKPLAVEYNLDTGDLARDFNLKPGQQIRVETKVTSPLGVTREFSSSFDTVSPVVVEAMTVDGIRYTPGASIPPQATLAFSFNKPVTQAAMALDGSDGVELTIDPADPKIATLPPTVSLKQGATHLFKIMATAADSAKLEAKEVRATVVKPLSLYGKVEDNGGPITIELDANTAFADIEAVKAALETTVPDATVSVEKQKIIITSSGLDRSGDYTIKLNRANGADGSFLEAPLTMTLSFKSQGAASAETSGSSYRGYVYTSGGSSTSTSASGGSSTDSGPPPGWPPCCPWPPQ